MILGGKKMSEEKKVPFVNSEANRNNPYTFDEYLDKLHSIDYYADDEWLQKVVKYFSGDDFHEIDEDLRRMSKIASTKWRKQADSAARLEERPYLIQYDGHNRRIDRIVRPAELLEMEREVFSEGIYSDKSNPWSRIAKMFIIQQNGEAGLSCPLVCTEGLINSVEVLGASHPEVERIKEHCKNGINGEHAIGSQFITEIQGGSDVPENILEAEPTEEEGVFRLYGTKYFCSAMHADYAIVTGKATGTTKTGLFLMPMWLPGNKEKEIRNDYTIDKIKWKIGTAELPTCEVTFNGTLAYQVGPLDRGTANLIAHVLTLSRLVVGLGGAANMVRPVREAKLYSQFRTAFDQKIGDFALVDNLLERNEYVYKRTLAGAFKIYGHYYSSRGKKYADISEKNRRKQWVARELVLLQKIQNAADSTFVIRECMSVFGGYAAIEDSSVLARLYRDAAVHELWEGPKNVLLAQMYRDFQRQVTQKKYEYSLEEFVADLLVGGEKDKIDGFAKELKILVDYGDLDNNDQKTKEMADRYEKWCEKVIHYYQDIAYNEVKNG